MHTGIRRRIDPHSLKNTNTKHSKVAPLLCVYKPILPIPTSFIYMHGDIHAHTHKRKKSCTCA